MKAYQTKPIEELNILEMAEYYEDNGHPLIAQMYRLEADRQRQTIEPPFIPKDLRT